jgi:hypothetical protein
LPRLSHGCTEPQCQERPYYNTPPSHRLSSFSTHWRSLCR